MVYAHEVVHAVHALQPTERVVFQVLKALYRVQHPACHAPFLGARVILHLACGVFPLASAVFHILVVVRQVHRSPVVVIHIVCQHLGKALVHLGRVGCGGGFHHAACTVIFKEDVLLSAVLAQHVDVRCY